MLSTFKDPRENEYDLTPLFIQERRKKTGLTYEEHAELGEKLQHLQVDLVNLTAHLSSAYGKSRRISSLSKKVVQALDALRCELDNLACAENPRDLFPDREPQRLYYGKGVFVPPRQAGLAGGVV